MTATVLVERDDGVVTVTLSNPTRRNAITMAMYDQLEAELHRISADPDVVALVLRGDGDSFAGGTDIQHLAEVVTGEDGVEYEARMRQVQLALLELRVPIVAAVRGACVGGGLVFAALSDLVYCTPDARFGSPIARTLGNTMSATSLARLYSLIGRRLTSDLLFTGRLMSADEALAAGLVNAVVEADQLDNTVGEILDTIRANAKLTIWSFKEFERRIDTALLEVPVDDVYRTVYGSADYREGVAAFLEKRTARFGTRSEGQERP